MALNYEKNDPLNEGMSLAEYTKANEPTVYQETEVSCGYTRIWLSFDIDDNVTKDQEGKTKRDRLYDWVNEQVQIESWGNSVGTFLVNKCFCDNTNTDIIEYLVQKLQKAQVLDRGGIWSQTKNISLYVTYRSRNNLGQRHSGQFVLIQNAKIRQPRGFRC